MPLLSKASQTISKSSSCSLHFNIGGTCAPDFAKVEKIFHKNFASGWEKEGAAIAIYHRGKLVVDLYGGYADKSALIKWTENTKTIVFSASKAVGSLAIAMLVDRGHIQYTDKISKFWPEFAQNGKADITLQWIMTHQAGLAVLDHFVSLEEAYQPEIIAKILEKQKPNWEPGTKTGYHAITYGWLVDLIIRRVDPLKRGIAQFVREEINQKHDVNFHLGLLTEQDSSVSRLSFSTKLYLLRELVYDPRILIVLLIMHCRFKNSLGYRIMHNNEWFRVEKKKWLYGHQGYGGISTARDLAKIFSLMLSGKLLSKDLSKQFSQPELLNRRDVVVGVPFSKGHGFMYEKHPTKAKKWLYGHQGYGGSTLMIEPEEELVIAYVSNSIKTGTGELGRCYRLMRNAALDCAMKR